MRPFREVLERYDSLWEQVESFVEAYLARHRLPVLPAQSTSSTPSTQSTLSTPPDLKELNTAVTILKRIQDARRAIQLDAMKMEVQATDDGLSSEDFDERISRVLRRLEENGDACATDEDDEDTV